MIKSNKGQKLLKERYQLAVGEVTVDKLCKELRQYVQSEIELEDRAYAASGRRKKVKVKVIDLIRS